MVSTWGCGLGFQGFGLGAGISCSPALEGSLRRSADGSTVVAEEMAMGWWRSAVGARKEAVEAGAIRAKRKRSICILCWLGLRHPHLDFGEVFGVGERDWKHRC